MTYPHTPGYSNDTTSKAAADKIEPVAGSIAAEVYASIKLKPQTCFEIEEACDLPHQTASARIRQLALMGAIEDSGAKRPTSSGRMAIVWRKTEAKS